VVDQCKQAVSIRLSESDIRNIKRMAKRLGFRDSDVIRYAIKTMLSRMAPLCDDAIKGRSLLPVLVESGDELIRHFELDSYRLEGIINAKAEPESRVDRDDIALLAMSGLRDQYLLMRMKDGHGVSHEAAARRGSLRDYLYEKYVYRNDEPRPEVLLPAEADARGQRPAA
jgi:Arc/MetJ-type ribon-helix-helix transcriptional regulator